MEKRGVGKHRTNHRVWSEHSSKTRRVEDHLCAIDAYLRDSDERRRVVLLGASEGGDVAASIAVRREPVSHLILLAVGGGWSQERELRHLLTAGVPIDKVETIEDFDRKLSEIRAAPDSSVRWAGLAYRRWSSYLWDSPLGDLLTLDIPIFVAHGTHDRSVPVESARAMVEAFAERGKKNVSYQEYADADHAFCHVVTGTSLQSLVQQDLVRWMTECGLASTEFVTRLTNELCLPDRR